MPNGMMQLFQEAFLYTFLDAKKPGEFFQILIVTDQVTWRLFKVNSFGGGYEVFTLFL